MTLLRMRNLTALVNGQLLSLVKQTSVTTHSTYNRTDSPCAKITRIYLLATLGSLAGLYIVDLGYILCSNLFVNYVI